VDARFGYESYKLYLGIKLHYNSDYDFNKYNGKVSASFESFLKRSDKFQFSKLRKQHRENLKDFYIANFMHKDYWIGDLFGEEAKENYTEWKKYNQSLLYCFEKDIRYLHSLEGVLDNLFSTDSSSHPIIVTSILSNSISFTTGVLLDSLIRWSSSIKITEQYVWPELQRRIQKTQGFIGYNNKKLKEKVLEIYDS
tara:strand:- start:395 stop:982 length:588 start_codon:yes stop_codon:yes gene_type:complete